MVSRKANPKKKRREKGQQSDHHAASRQAHLGTARTTRIVLGVGDDLMRAGARESLSLVSLAGPVAVSPETAPAQEARPGCRKDYSSTPVPGALLAGLRVVSTRGVSGSPGSARDTLLARSCGTVTRVRSSRMELGTSPAMPDVLCLLSTGKLASVVDRE
jgi:hypothetical protein